MLARLSVVLACAVLLAGCGGDPVAQDDKILIPSTSSPLGPSDGGTGAATGDAKPKKQKRAPKTVVARGAGVSLTGPVGWSVLDKATISSNGGQRVEDIARQVGVPVTTLEAMIAAVDVYLTNYSGVLTVGRYAGAMPTREAFQAQFGNVPASVEPARTRSTPLGEGRLFRYRMTLGSLTQSGGSLYVRNGSGIVEITSAGPDGDTALEILDSVVRSLARA